MDRYIFKVEWSVYDNSWKFIWWSFSFDSSWSSQTISSLKKTLVFKYSMKHLQLQHLFKSTELTEVAKQNYYLFKVWVGNIDDDV